MPGPWEKYSQAPQMVAPNPMFPGQVARQEQEIQQGGLTLGRMQAEQPYVAPKAAADATNAQANAQVSAATAQDEIALKRAAAAKAAMDNKNLAQTGGASVEEAKAGGFYSRALNANKLYEAQGVGAPPMGRNIAKALLPDTLVNEFTDPRRQQSEAAMRDFIAATLRYESGAAISPSEFENQQKIYFPIPGDSPETLAFKAQLRQQALKALDIGSGVAANRAPNAVDAATQGGQYYAPPQLQAATGGVASEIDPQMAAAVDRMIRMRRPDAEIIAYAKSKGGNVLDPAKIAEAKRYLGGHPDYKGSFVSATKQRPTTLAEQLAASPLSGYFNGAGTALTGGFNDEIAGGLGALMGGNYTEGRDAFNAKKALVADENPTADLLGNVTGSALAMRGIGKSPGTLGSLLGRGGGLAGDAAYGATYGAGQSNGDRLGGATLGGLAGGAGSILGQGVAKGAAGLISPSGGAMAPLYAMGVRPSIGQRAGGVINNFEEKLQSIPVVGDAIAGTRQRARDQYQIGLFNDALGEIGHQLPKGMEPGHAPHAYAQKAFNVAYDAAQSNMTAAADPPLAQGLGQLQQSIQTLRPESQAVFDKVWAGSVARRFSNGALAGPAYKDAMSELGKKASAIRKSPTGDHELADALDQAMGILRDSAGRNSPPEAVAAMEAADRGYAKLVRLEDASRRAGGDAATFSPKQYEAAVKQMSGGIRSRGYLAGNALNADIAQTGLQLGDVVSNSGSIDRLLPAMAATGAGFVEPNSAAALGLYGLINAPGLRNVTTGIMAPRGGPVAQGAAGLIRKKLTGPFASLGAGTGIALTAPR